MTSIWRCKSTSLTRCRSSIWPFGEFDELAAVRCDGAAAKIESIISDVLSPVLGSATLVVTIRSIPHIYRNVKRGTEIVAVLSKYGLADWLAQTNIDFAKDRLASRDGEALA